MTCLSSTGRKIFWRSAGTSQTSGTRAVQNESDNNLNAPLPSNRLLCVPNPVYCLLSTVYLIICRRAK